LLAIASLVGTTPSYAQGVGEVEVSEIIAPPQANVFTMDSVSFSAGPCPEVWPERVLATFASTGMRPLEERCQSVVADLAGDGAVDAVFSASTPTGNAYVVVLDGPPPRLVEVSAKGRFDSLYRVNAGRHRLNGCFDSPEGGRFEFSHTGFAISHDEKYMTYHHFEDGELIGEEGSGC
jgi:hypothetical protein